MEKNVIVDIIKKINEYNLGLLSEYKTEDRGHCFITTSMIIFFDEDDESLSITFQADQKPENVATTMLILKEIPSIKNIKIMESFIYDSNNKYIQGEEAHELIKKSIISQALLQASKEQFYIKILENTKGHVC